jgi:protein-disulfide isomerase
MTSNTPRPTRSEQREAARAKAKALREQQQRGDKRKRIFIQLGIAASVIVAVGAVALTIFSASTQSRAIPTNATFNDGVKVGTDLKVFTPTFTPTSPSGEEPIEIVIYVDYACPVCAIFDLPNTQQLKDWASKGFATVEIHPIANLDGRSIHIGTYSSRSANAAICVSEYSPDNFFDYSTRLMQAQPSKDVPEPKNVDLIEFAEEVGATNINEVSSCINSKEFEGWVDDATKIANVGTPTIFVNGVQYNWSTGEELASPARFAQFVALVTSGELN